MSKYQDWLIQHIKNNPEFIQPERYRNEVLSFLKEPLEDLCISRPTSRLTWGIPLPFDENFVTYVWFDALINYLTGLDYPDGDNFKKFWPVAHHVIAKDILKPHGIYWPIMLKAIGLEPYKSLHVHGYWKMKDVKMSKSLGNIVTPTHLVEQFGSDATRYCLMTEMTFGLDAGFSMDSFTTRINADLANDLGNLLSRTATMVGKFRSSRVPEEQKLSGPQDDLRLRCAKLPKIWMELMEGFQFNKAMAEIWKVLNMANKVIDTTAPWQLAREEGKGKLLDDVLYCLIETLRLSAVMISPVMPGASQKILDTLGISTDTPLSSYSLNWGLTPPGAEIKKPGHLFPRIGPSRQETKKAKAEKKAESKARSKKEKGATMESENLVSIDDFAKLDIRVAEIVAAEKHPNADRLLKLTVRCPDERTVVAGIAEHFSPEELVGKKVLVVANLKPVKLRGVESKGMMLVAKDQGGLKLLEAPAETSPGAKVS